MGLTTTMSMGRWTGVHIIIVIMVNTLCVPGTTPKENTWVPFPTWPHLDMTTAAQNFSLTKASRWLYSKSCPIFFLLSFKQGLIVAGGYYNIRLASTELFLPSKNQWTTGANLPRQNGITIIFTIIFNWNLIP